MGLNFKKTISQYFMHSEQLTKTRSEKIKHAAISIHNGLLGNRMFGKQCIWIQLGGKNQIIIQWKALNGAIGILIQKPSIFVEKKKEIYWI